MVGKSEDETTFPVNKIIIGVLVYVGWIIQPILTDYVREFVETLPLTSDFILGFVIGAISIVTASMLLIILIPPIGNGHPEEEDRTNLKAIFGSFIVVSPWLITIGIFLSLIFSGIVWVLGFDLTLGSFVLIGGLVLLAIFAYYLVDYLNTRSG